MGPKLGLKALNVIARPSVMCHNVQA